MTQEYFGIGSIEKLKEILTKEQPRKIFLVTGNNSYNFSGAKDKIEPLLSSYSYCRFFDFSINPRLEDIKKGIELYREEGCDLVIAVGGGSVIDIAKAVNALAWYEEDPNKYITNELMLTKKGKPIVAIPTTAGTGSEATHFSVVYVDKTKYSLAHKEFLIPDYVIMDPSLTLKLSSYITACTGMDALTQAIEGYWSVNSTEEARTYAEEAIKLSINNIEVAANEPTPESRTAMMKAANLAGKAINISKTTACHAISYPITSYFGVPHGHAVALTLGEMIIYNSQVSEKDCLDNRGIKYAEEMMRQVYNLLRASSAEEANQKIQELMSRIGLKRSLSQLGIKDQKEFDLIIKNGFNPERVKNNPRKLTEEEIKVILEKIK